RDLLLDGGPLRVRSVVGGQKVFGRLDKIGQGKATSFHARTFKRIRKRLSFGIRRGSRFIGLALRCLRSIPRSNGLRMIA
ncbi:hypothetical protein JYB64_27360, partial [Algoriphagus aestuarii]|nr:hypothetical protein [Algoriphagus aestuarii]